MIESLLSIGGLVHSVAAGVRHGRKIDELLSRFAGLSRTVEELSSSILYLPTLAEVRAISGLPASAAPARREVKQALEPVQRMLGGTILATAAIRAPEKTSQALARDPWSVLVDIRPLSSLAPHSNPNMLPIVFDHAGATYLGWQMRGILPVLFDIELADTPTPSAAVRRRPQNRRRGVPMATIPEHLLYTEEHGYVHQTDTEDEVEIGITDYAQGELGDVVYVDLPAVPSEFAKMEQFGTIEAVKAVSELYCPVSGEVIEVNTSLESDPSLVNKDPYGAGWMIRIRVKNRGELEELLGPDEYASHIGQ